MTDRTEISRPDVERVLAPLKDFQRKTVDYVFGRLYTDADCTPRFLVADEVGLGKTLVGRGVVARAVDHLWDSVGRIDVVYICSNGDIARQNINRLNITGRADWALPSRITLLPLQIHEIAQRKVNFVAFTPGTTFKLASSGGRVDERLLLYCLLEEVWELRGTAPLNLFQGNVRSHEHFRQRVREFRSEQRIDQSLRNNFLEAVAAHDRHHAVTGEPRLREDFERLSGLFAYARKHIPEAERRLRDRLIGELRGILASTCIRALEPDLVILDEFQRFKELLVTETEEVPDEVLLAQELFNYGDGDEKARILLLSATPYKMYTNVQEAGAEDHYADFLATLAFLQAGDARAERVGDLLQRYRQALWHLADDAAEVKAVQGELKSELRRVMVRTERLAASADRNGMLRETVEEPLSLSAREVLSYDKLQRLAAEVGHPDTIEYWKAAPYLMSFMDDYKLKQAVQERLKARAPVEALQKVLAAPDLFMPRSIVHGRASVTPPHARLRWALDTCLEGDLWQLLWMPAAMPYYLPRGAFACSAGTSPTKRLVFSAWQVVPKALAGLVSYEAERRMLDGVLAEARTLRAARERLVQLLRFSRSEGRLTGMPVLALMYPGAYLADVGDPCLSDPSGPPPTADRLLTEIERRIESDLKPLVRTRAPARGLPDEAWYWAAPILLDLAHDDTTARAWLEQADLAPCWTGELSDRAARNGNGANGGAPADAAEQTAWADHLDRARTALHADFRLDGPPPVDLVQVLAQLALAGPGVCALRALARGAGSRASRSTDLRNAAAEVSWGFRTLFNTPEVIGLVRGGDGDEPYWRKALDYAVSGNLQAVLDEYAHVLRDSRGLLGRKPEDEAAELAPVMRRAVALAPARIRVDELGSTHGRPALLKQDMRARFAMRFGDEVDDDGRLVNRKEAVREAFNSPFWPFVLVTTSVGQEGLDFHSYCHCVVHWNLPNNPVDLEQREGRVHRYKGHAVRKNVVARNASARRTEGDPWAHVFEAARDARDRDATDIVPYWVYAGPSAIERRVPTLPLSRDEIRLSQLRRSLAIYRLVFGQPRQDELLDVLADQIPADELGRLAEKLRIDLAPPNGMQPE